MRAGRPLEILVHTLERALARNPSARIESPGWLEDIFTGAKREFDVLILTKEGLHTVTVAIECRDRSRPFGVPDLEAFRQKCSDTRVSKAVVVSSSGFQGTTRAKAEAYGISCIALEEADSFDWLLFPAFPLFSQRLLHIALELNVDTPALEAIKSDQLTFRSSDGEVTLEDVKNRIRQYVLENAHAISESGNFTMPFTFNSHGLEVVLDDTGESFPVRQFKGAAYFSVQRTESRFELLRYGDSQDAASGVEVAVAPIALGPLGGTILIVMGSDGGEVVFVKDRQ